MRVKLRHFPPSQLKARHQTSCSLLSGGPQNQMVLSGPPCPPQAGLGSKGEKDRMQESGHGTQHEGGAGKGTPPTHNLQGEQTSRMETWATLREVGGEA